MAEQNTPTDQLDSEVAATMRAYGAGEIGAEQAAEQIAPAYAYAKALHSGEYDELADEASEPHAYLEVALARQRGIITMEQYAALGQALIKGNGQA